MDLGNT